MPENIRIYVVDPHRERTERQYVEVSAEEAEAFPEFLSGFAQGVAAAKLTELPSILTSIGYWAGLGARLKKPVHCGRSIAEVSRAFGMSVSERVTSPQERELVFAHS